jgi:hypothetical protein
MSDALVPEHNKVNELLEQLSVRLGELRRHL